jgi:hypothetical protein
MKVKERLLNGTACAGNVARTPRGHRHGPLRDGGGRPGGRRRDAPSGRALLRRGHCQAALAHPVALRGRRLDEGRLDPAARARAAPPRRQRGEPSRPGGVRRRGASPSPRLGARSSDVGPSEPAGTGRLAAIAPPPAVAPGRFVPVGLARRSWATSGPVRDVCRRTFAEAGRNRSASHPRPAGSAPAGSAPAGGMEGSRTRVPMSSEVWPGSGLPTGASGSGGPAHPRGHAAARSGPP